MNTQSHEIHQISCYMTQPSQYKSHIKYKRESKHLGQTTSDTIQHSKYSAFVCRICSQYSYS